MRSVYLPLFREEGIGWMCQASHEKWMGMVEIVEIKEKLQTYYEKDMDKLKKIQQMLNGANNSSKDENW